MASAEPRFIPPRDNLSCESALFRDATERRPYPFGDFAPRVCRRGGLPLRELLEIFCADVYDASLLSLRIFSFNSFQRARRSAIFASQPAVFGV